MTELLWDQTGEKKYETGVDKGVLFVKNTDGTFADGVAWNGLTTVTESPAGAEATKTYADNRVYGTLISAETFGATIEAYTYPTAFGICDGSAELQPGVTIGQQSRRPFGFAYRTLIGNDTEGQDAGYQIHLVYDATAAPSEKAHATVNDSPEMLGLSWEVSTTPIDSVTGKKPTATLTIDSTLVDADDLAAFEEILYGSESEDARLPLPAEVADLFAGGALTDVDLTVPANQPAYNAGTHVVTLPAVAGVQWKINGANKASGAQPALIAGQVANIKATPTAGNRLVGSDDWAFAF